MRSRTDCSLCTESTALALPPQAHSRSSPAVPGRAWAPPEGSRRQPAVLQPHGQHLSVPITLPARRLVVEFLLFAAPSSSPRLRAAAKAAGRAQPC